MEGAISSALQMSTTTVSLPILTTLNRSLLLSCFLLSVDFEHLEGQHCSSELPALVCIPGGLLIERMPAK